MKDVIVKSFAKLNIGLQVRSKRNDQYHNIQTIFQEVDLYDSLKVTKINKGIDFKSNVSWLKNDDSNLCVKAFKRMSSIYKIGGIRIDLTKRIPVYAGLGGGSSNAAKVLSCINKLYNLRLSSQNLESIGSRLGADVPFFINGGAQLGEGIGDQLTPIKHKFNQKFLIVLPNISIETSWAYNKIKTTLDKSKNFVNLYDCLKKKEISFENFDNDFEKIIIPAYPEIGNLISIIRENNARLSSLSGTGSTVFGIFDDEATAKVAESAIPKRHKTLIVDPIYFGA
ncbi:MAG: 4-(cytidine 5'-diphospho)-2-C-methyl-D-erythritol kinase [Candidatus Neomarinimicrobiota bacterium]